MIYADILIILNFLVDYFLILATAKLLHRKNKVGRHLLASFFGGISSLYIFLPQFSVIGDLILKILICVITVLIAFKFESLKMYIKSAILFFIVTSGYAGAMFAIWRIFKPKGLVINNSQVYLNISPIILVIVTTVTYMIFWVLQKIFSNGVTEISVCEIKVFSEDKQIDLTALIDTGNSVEDLFGKSEIIIVDNSKLVSLFGDNYEKNEGLKSRFRVVPFNTVSGQDMLKGMRCDRAEISKNKKKIELEKPILAASKLPLTDGFNAIVNPKIFS